MTKRKRKLTREQKAAKAKRRLEYETIFINGKQKSVKREPTVDGIPVDEFIRNNADPIWLHQNEMWELMEPFDDEEDSKPEPARNTKKAARLDDDLPF
jgi:hypothetical protein